MTNVAGCPAGSRYRAIRTWNICRTRMGDRGLGRLESANSLSGENDRLESGAGFASRPLGLRSDYLSKITRIINAENTAVSNINIPAPPESLLFIFAESCCCFRKNYMCSVRAMISGLTDSSVGPLPQAHLKRLIPNRRCLTPSLRSHVNL